MIKSKALEINLADYHVDVAIDKKYFVLQEIMSGYYGLMEGLNTFLKELSHPYKNWKFILKEARGYCLDYFYLLKDHPRGCNAAAVYLNIFINALESESEIKVRKDAVDNLLLYITKIVRESGPGIERFMPVVDNSFNRIRNFDQDNFFLFITSFYRIKKIAEDLYAYSDKLNINFDALNLLLIKYYTKTYSYWLSEEDILIWFHKEAGDIGNIEKTKPILNDISHNQINQWKTKLENIIRSENFDFAEQKNINLLKRLIELPGYKQIVEIYRQIPQRLLELGKKEGLGNQWKVIFLFYTMNISGLGMIHEDVLRDIQDSFDEDKYKVIGCWHHHGGHGAFHTRADDAHLRLFYRLAKRLGSESFLKIRNIPKHSSIEVKLNEDSMDVFLGVIPSGFRLPLSSLPEEVKQYFLGLKSLDVLIGEALFYASSLVINDTCFEYGMDELDKLRQGRNYFAEIIRQRYVNSCKADSFEVRAPLPVTIVNVGVVAFTTPTIAIINISRINNFFILIYLTTNLLLP